MKLKGISDKGISRIARSIRSQDGYEDNDWEDNFDEEEEVSEIQLAEIFRGTGRRNLESIVDEEEAIKVLNEWGHWGGKYIKGPSEEELSLSLSDNAGSGFYYIDIDDEIIDKLGWDDHYEEDISGKYHIVIKTPY